MRDRLREWLAQNGWPDWIVPGYWFLLCLSLILGSLLTIHLWKRSGQDKQRAADLIFWAIPSLFVGAKVLYWLQFGLPERLDFWNSGGISLYGGFFGLTGAWLVQYWLRPYPILLFLDCTTPSLALGLFFTRIGCFLAGCNGGAPCDLPWAVRFPSTSSTFHNLLAAGLARTGEKLSPPVHPTQLYESLFGLTAFFLLIWFFRKRRQDGQLFYFGMAGYGIFRFFMELIRSDTGGLHPFGVLTFAQMISLLIVAASLTFLWRIAYRNPENRDI
jgi:phosphatidylglycerol---prolipoprotein diacylglyceryl transferase